MLARANRLTNSRSFDVIYRKGESIKGKYLVLYSLTSKFSTVKVGFVVAKKVGKAVVRNKVKRRLREIIKEFLPLIVPNFSYILVARSEAGSADYSELQAEVKDLLTRGKKINGDQN